jgi:hypothetical protein
MSSFLPLISLGASCTPDRRHPAQRFSRSLASPKRATSSAPVPGGAGGTASTMAANRRLLAAPAAPASCWHACPRVKQVCRINEVIEARFQPRQSPGARRHHRAGIRLSTRERFIRAGVPGKTSRTEGKLYGREARQALCRNTPNVRKRRPGLRSGGALGPRQVVDCASRCHRSSAHRRGACTRHVRHSEERERSNGENSGWRI